MTTRRGTERHGSTANQPDPNAPSELVVAHLMARAAEATGFSVDAIQVRSVVDAAMSLIKRGATEADLIRMVNTREDQLTDVLLGAVAVGETYFCRHPEHFQFVLEWAQTRQEARRVRAWSAGCATGEEAYSLAACLLSGFPPETGTRIEVLGTDLLPGNVRKAREATYGAWSVRVTQLFPTFDPFGTDEFRVRKEVRAVTSFQVHNLLDAAPGDSSFDIVMCRNVLVYFKPDLADAVRRRLARAVAPGGILVFGTMDAAGSPPGMVRCGSPDVQAFRRVDRVTALPAPAPALPRRAEPSPPPAARLARSPRAPAAPPTLPPSATESASRAPESAVERHLAALDLIEQGHRVRAQRLLIDLTTASPDYLPGLLERAVLHERTGEAAKATELMRDIVRRARGLRPDETIEGPEPMPVEYFLTAATAYLQRKGIRP